MNKIRLLSKEEAIPYNLLLLADEDLDAINKYIFDCEIYVVEQENKIIAEYALQPIDADLVEIKNIAVLAEFQARGIGKSLLRDAVDRARSRGFRAINVGTGNAATKQLHLYQKEGFKISGVRKNFFVDNYLEPSLRTEKNLKI